jgi:hypothetical protein
MLTVSVVPRSEDPNADLGDGVAVQFKAVERAPNRAKAEILTRCLLWSVFEHEKHTCLIKTYVTARLGPF